jgi:hypothetical protein
MAMSERLFAAGLEQLSGTVVQIRNDTKGRLDRLEQQFANAEEAVRFNTNALGHALERLEILVHQRAADVAESQHRGAQIKQRCDGLDESLARLKACFSEADFNRRLDTLEDAIDDAAAKLKRDDSRARAAASIQAVMNRLESLEQSQAKLWEELRGPVFVPAGSPHGEPIPAAEVPDFVEPPDSFFWAPSDAEADRVDNSARTEPSFEEIYVRDKVEDYPARERYAARERSNKPALGYLVPVAVALLVVMALATALVLSEHRREMAPMRSVAAVPGMQTYSLPEPADSYNETVFVVAAQADGPPKDEAKNTLTPPSERGGPSRDRVIGLANSGNPTALTILGLRALDDSGAAPVNLPDAVRFLTKAAEKGQPVAQFRLGSMYEHAEGVATDLAKAAHWYEMAANQGNRKAMHNLAVFYATGALGRKNMGEAARWFEKAATLGVRDSQFNLAYLYESGDGVPQDLESAYKWYSIAAADGDKEAKARARITQDQLNATGRSAADKAAANFHAAPLNQEANVYPVANGL